MLDLLFLALGALLALALGYSLLLALVGVLPSTPPRRTAGRDQLRFLVVVPAHDEEGRLGRTLRSLARLEGPAEGRHVVVVADHCTDGTARVARAHGADVLELGGPEPRGKGAALARALPALLAAYPEAQAVCIVDADTRVQPNLLVALGARLARGAAAVQAYYDVDEPEASPSASLTWFGFVLSRRLKYHPRAGLGLSSNLVGNGMAFARATLEHVPWEARSASEDLEYQLALVLAGERVDFALETRVWGPVPAPGSGFARQRTRWDLGRAELRRRTLRPLLARGLRGDLRALDTLAELVIPPYTLLAALVPGSLVAWTLAAGLGPGTIARGPFPLLVGLQGALALLLVLGLLVERPSPRVLANLLQAPRFLLLRVVNALRGLAGAPARWAGSVAPVDHPGRDPGGDRASG